MKTFAAILAVTVTLLPAIALAQTCERKWREAHGTACPVGAVYDSVSNVCIVRGS